MHFGGRKAFVVRSKSAAASRRQVTTIFTMLVARQAIVVNFEAVVLGGLSVGVGALLTIIGFLFLYLAVNPRKGFRTLDVSTFITFPTVSDAFAWPPKRESSSKRQYGTFPPSPETQRAS